jgi:hypothetical protein
VAVALTGGMRATTSSARPSATLMLVIARWICTAASWLLKSAGSDE